MAHNPFGSAFEQMGKTSSGVDERAFPAAPQEYGIKPLGQQAALLRAPQAGAQGTPDPAMPPQSQNNTELVAKVTSLEARIQALEVLCKQHYSGSGDGLGLKIMESPYMTDGELP